MQQHPVTWSDSSPDDLADVPPRIAVDQPSRRFGKSAAVAELRDAMAAVGGALVDPTRPENGWATPIIYRLRDECGVHYELVGYGTTRSRHSCFGRDQTTAILRDSMTGKLYVWHKDEFLHRFERVR